MSGLTSKVENTSRFRKQIRGDEGGGGQ